MHYDVRRVEDRRGTRDFLDLPRALHRLDPCHVPMLRSVVKGTVDSRRNPYFAHASLDLLVGYDAGRPIARASVVVDRRQVGAAGEQRAFFGFFECVDDTRAATALLDEAAAVARSRGASVLEGPFNPNPYSELGLRMNRFDAPPTFFQTHNPSYYPTLLERSGFEVSARLFTARNDHVREFVAARYGKGPHERASGGFSVRSLDRLRIAEDLDRIRVVMNESFAENWRFQPLTPEEYAFGSKSLLWASDPDLVKVVEHEGRSVGALMCVLDVNPVLRRLGGRLGPIGFLRFLWGRRRVRRVVILAVGILPAFRRSRAFALLLQAVCGIAGRFDALETSWMMPGNGVAFQAAKRLGLEPDVEFAVYERRLS